MIQSTTKSAYCRDCFKRIPPESEYCPHCGQKNFNGKIKVRSIFKEFLADVFGLESKIWRSIYPMLFQPGRLTQEYFRGRHKSFISPLRSFGLMTILLIAASIAQGIQADLGIGKRRDLTIERNAQDSLFASMEKQMDTVAQEFEHPQVRMAFDSIQSRLQDSELNFGSKNKSSATFQVAGLKMEYDDLTRLSNDELFKKYDADSRFKKLLIRQAKKFVIKGDNFLVFVVKNSSWTIFLLIPIFAFLLHILHIKRKRYYVEHLIFGIHFHTAAFFIMLILMLMIKILPTIIFQAAIVYLSIYLLLAMKRYYQQSWGKTIFKFILLVLSYNLIILVALGVTVLIGFVLY